MKQTILFLFLLPALTLSQSAAHAAEESSAEKLNRSVKLFQKADYLNAIDELKTIPDGTDENRYSFVAYYLMGMAYKALGSNEDSAVWLKRSLKYEPLADYAVYNMGETYLGAGNFQDALDAFSTIKIKFPDSRWVENAAFKSSLALFRLGRYDESISSLNGFMREYPRSSLMPQGRLIMAEIYEKMGKLNEAYNQYKAIWVNHPLSQDSRTAAEKMERIASEYVTKTASEKSFAIVEIDERYSRTCNLFSFGNYREGIKELTALMEEFDKMGDGDRPTWHAEALLKLGEAYFHVREDNNALKVLNRLSTGASPPRIVEEAAFLSARAMQRSGKRADAADAFDQLINAFPGREVGARGTFRRADMAEGDGDIAKAIGLYQSLYRKTPKSPLADDAMWREGWLNYLGKDYNKAYHIFSKLLSEYPGSEFVDTATYWSARTAEKLNMPDKSMAHYFDVINNFPLSYYYVVARGRMTETPARTIKTVSYMPQHQGKAPDRYVIRHLEKSKALINLGFKEDASVELSLAEARCSDKSTLLEIAGLMTSIGEYNKAQRIALNGLQGFLRDEGDPIENEILKFAFPAGFRDDVIYNAGKNFLNPFLIHAVIKEESAYRHDAVSRAGAIGLMQLMPSTGKQMSKEAGFYDYATESLYRSEVNISLGSSYLKKLVDGSKGKVPLAIASYNAGPNVVSTWVERYGTEEMDEFIEKIPYPETRNYVKKVLRSYGIYEKLYGQSMGQIYSKGPSKKEDVVALEGTGMQMFE